MLKDPTKIIDLANAFYKSCILFAAIDLEIFNIIDKHKHMTHKKLSEYCNFDQRGTRLLLDACVSIGLLYKKNEYYENTSESSFFLVKESPGDLSKAICYNRDVYPAWGKLKKFVQTGKPVEKPALHLGFDRDRTRTFVLSMHYKAKGIAQIVLPYLDLSNCDKVLDVGGGPGTYSVLLSQKYPEAEFTVIDLPDVVSIASELIKEQRADSSVATLAGDYHIIDFPQQNDAVLFFGMLHQESEEDIIKLLTKGYSSLNDGGKIYILDMMTDDTHTKPEFSALFAVNMALTTENGWVFSDSELDSWVKIAGFKNFFTKRLPQPLVHWLAVAEK